MCEITFLLIKAMAMKDAMRQSDEGDRSENETGRPDEAKDGGTEDGLTAAEINALRVDTARYVWLIGQIRF